VQTNPATIRFYERPIRKAASMTDDIILEIKKNAEQASLQQRSQKTKPRRQTERGKDQPD
jgi:hypothetical protein